MIRIMECLLWASLLCPSWAHAYDWTNVFGAQLRTKDGLKNTNTVLSKANTVGIYFSAHWCGPCQDFTPILAQQYNDWYKARGMEIVFVSNDNQENEFESYYSSMPWTALPFNQNFPYNLEVFTVQGIPNLKFFDAQTGRPVKQDGVSFIRQNTHAAIPFPIQQQTPRLYHGDFVRVDNLGSEVGQKLWNGKEGQISGEQNGKWKVDISMLFKAKHLVPEDNQDLKEDVKVFFQNISNESHKLLITSNDWGVIDSIEDDKYKVRFQKAFKPENLVRIQK